LVESWEAVDWDRVTAWVALEEALTIDERVVEVTEVGREDVWDGGVA
jgi:hypothetical protein